MKELNLHLSIAFLIFNQLTSFLNGGQKARQLYFFVPHKHDRELYIKENSYKSYGNFPFSDPRKSV